MNVFVSKEFISFKKFMNDRNLQYFVMVKAPNNIITANGDVDSEEGQR